MQALGMADSTTDHSKINCSSSEARGVSSGDCVVDFRLSSRSRLLQVRKLGQVHLPLDSRLAAVPCRPASKAILPTAISRSFQQMRDLISSSCTSRVSTVPRGDDGAAGERDRDRR